MNWDRWKPTQEEPWDWVRAAHLYRRAGFSPSWATVEEAVKQGVDSTIDRILDTQLQTPEGLEFESMSKCIGDAAVASENADRLRAWWIYRMIKTQTPLVERMTLLWHNHFATSNDKVKDLGMMYEQNQTLRSHCLGKFGDLLHAIVRGPAMLVWLDAQNNRKEHPNQNLARELLELFTFGQGHYSETDVAEAARCLTGWTVRRRQFVLDVRHQDLNDKSVLGHTAKMDGNDLIELLLTRPETSRRVAWRLCQMFFGESIVPRLSLGVLAEEMREHDLDLRWGVERILRSNWFFSNQNIRSRIASPVEYVLGAIRSLELDSRPPNTLLLARRLQGMGQDLFYPPNVFGWTEGNAWINTRSVIARGNFANALLTGQLHHPPVGWEPLKLAEKYQMSGSQTKVVEFFDLLLCNGTHALGTAENQRPNDEVDSDQIRERVVQWLLSAECQVV
jgi:uncharacterized protein (DUF1800 family)